MVKSNRQQVGRMEDTTLQKEVIRYNPQEMRDVGKPRKSEVGSRKLEVNWRRFSEVARAVNLCLDVKEDMWWWISTVLEITLTNKKIYWFINFLVFIRLPVPPWQVPRIVASSAVDIVPHVRALAHKTTHTVFAERCLVKYKLYDFN